MAKIQNPQDQNGINLINQTLFDIEHEERVTREDDIQTKLTNITGYAFEEVQSDVNISFRIDKEVERASNEENRIEEELNEKINEESIRATAKEDEIANELSAEIDRATKEDENLVIAIKAESDRASEAENEIIETLSSFVGENITTETETLISAERDLILGQIEQKFESTNTSPITVRGFGEIIQKSGQLKSIKLSCPTSSNTTNEVWLKVFEKITDGNTFIGISDNTCTHGTSETLLYTFDNSDVYLYANKEYYFVFCTEGQKDLTVYYSSNHSADCCLKSAPNSSTGGVLGSDGYSNTQRKPIYNIFLNNSVVDKAAFDAHISDKNIHLSADERVALDEMKTNFTNNISEINTDNLNTYGFMVKAPRSGSLKNVTTFCRESGSASGQETYLKIWNEANECIGCSVNKFAHSLNAVHEYNFENITLEKDEYYKFSYVEDESQKTTNETSSNVLVCLKSTETFLKTSSDQIFNGYSLSQNLDRQVISNTNSVQIITEINFFTDIENLEKRASDIEENILTIETDINLINEKISDNSESISELGLDIDAINSTINSMSEPTLEVLMQVASGEYESVSEINLDVYTTDESGTVSNVDTLPDINISYQCSDGFIYTSNAVALSPFINVTLSAGNQYTETGDQTISEARAQHDAILQFSDLTAIQEDITRVIIFDAIIAGLDHSGCKHISYILPVHFHVAPADTEEN